MGVPEILCKGYYGNWGTTGPHAALNLHMDHRTLMPHVLFYKYFSSFFHTFLTSLHIMDLYLDTEIFLAFEKFNGTKWDILGFFLGRLRSFCKN